MNSLNRRTFLRSSAVLIGGLSAQRIAAAAEPQIKPPKRKFTMELSCGMIGVGARPREAIDLAAHFGFESVAPADDYLARLSDSELQEVLGSLKEKGLVWGASGLPLEFRRDEASFTTGLKKLPGWAKALSRAGVTRVDTWLNPCHSWLTYLANFRQHAQRLRDVAKVLGEHGMRLGLEYVGPKTSWTSARYPFIHTMAEMKELIAEIGQSSVGFLLDSWHWYTAGEGAADLLTLRGQDVIACHLNDAPVGIRRDEQKDDRRALPCATGVIDSKAFLGSLAKIGYDGPVAAEPFFRPLREMPRDQALQTTAAAMKKAFALVE
jgi:sugar phosphate isomerase/epimerase